jgi:predicted Zn-dependent protease
MRVRLEVCLLFAWEFDVRKKLVFGGFSVARSGIPFAVALPAWLLVLALSSPLSAQQLTAALLLGPVVDNPQDARYADVAAAVEQFNLGDAAGTRTLLTEAAGKLPELPPAETLLAQMYFLSGQAGAGRTTLEIAAAQTPADPEAYLVLANIALGEGRLTEAYLLYARGESLCAAYDKNARRKHGMQVGACSGMSAAALRRERWDDAAAALTAWLTLDPKSVEAQSRLGRVQFHQNKLEEAYKTFQNAYAQDKSLPRPEISMGLLYEELVARGDASRRESAQRAMLAAAQSDPDSLDTRLAVARWALEACQIDVAEENSAAALKLAPQSVDALLLSGLTARHRGDAATARQMLEAAHLQAPGDPLLLAQLAVVLAEPKEPQGRAQALDYARLAVAAAGERGPAARDAAAALAWVLFHSGRQADAAGAVQSALQSGPLTDENAYFAAVILEGAGQRDSALRLLEAATQANRCYPTRAAAQALRDKLRAAP